MNLFSRAGASLTTTITLSLVLCVSLLVSAAERDGAIETAVLSTEGGRLIALPVLSFPMVPKQTQAEGFEDSTAVFESRMEVSSDRCASEKATTEDGTWSCGISPSSVAQHHHMRFAPTRWVNSAGATFSVQGGRIFETGVGSGIGFDLGPILPTFTGSEGGRLLLSDASGFPSKASVAEARWRKWPELVTELKRWGDRQVARCGQNKACTQAAALLAAPERMKGQAQELTLRDGRKIQYLSASSRSAGPGVLTALNQPDYVGETASSEPDTLEISLWRVEAKDGTARTLRSSQSIWSWLSGEAELRDPYCGSQCSGGWNPEMFTVADRAFAFGTYQTGTVSGYMFVEITDTELKLLGWYRWGS